MTGTTTRRSPSTAAHLLTSDARPLDLRQRAIDAGAELRVRDGRAWVVVVGPVDATRAEAIAGLVGDLARQPWLHRAGVDLTCTVETDRQAAATLERLDRAAPPNVDVSRPGPLISHLPWVA